MGDVPGAGQSEAPSKAGRDAGVDFLLAEFASSNDLIQRYRERIDKRTDLLLTIVTVSVGGLTLLSQLHLDLTLFFGIATLVALTISIQAGYVELDMLKTDALIAVHDAAIHRIRRYFAEQYPEVQQALLLLRAPSDASVPIVSSNRLIPQIVTALSIGALVPTLWSLMGDAIPTTPVLLAGGIVAAVTALVSETFIRRKYTELARSTHRK